MIHPAMPKTRMAGPSIVGNPPMEVELSIEEERGAELAFRSVVRWMEECNVLPFSGVLILTEEDWQSLREAAGLEEKP